MAQLLRFRRGSNRFGHWKRTFWRTFVGPDVTRPKITTRTYTHARAPPPNIAACWDPAWCARGGEKRKTSGVCGLRHSSGARAAFLLCCISDNGGGGARQHETARVCMHVCPRGRTVPSGGISELFYLLPLLSASSAMVKLDGHVWRPARLFPRTDASHLARERKYLFPCGKFFLLPVSLIIFLKTALTAHFN